MDNKLFEKEALAIAWLRDENAIQRNIKQARSGKVSVVEHDISGGLFALLQMLRNGSKPLSFRLREAIAHALDPRGMSSLQLKKRSRNKPGRPSKENSTRMALSEAYDVQAIPAKISEQMKKRKIPAAGEVGKSTLKSEAIAVVLGEENISRSKAYDLKRKNKVRK